MSIREPMRPVPGNGSEAVAVRPIEFEGKLVDRIARGIKRMSPPVAAASRAADEDSELRRTLHEAIQKELSDSAVGRIDPNMVPMLDSISRTVQDRRDEVSEVQINDLVEALVAAKDPTAEVRADIDADNAKARVRFMERIPSYTSEQVSQLAGHQAKNKSQTASRWKGEGRIFSVPWRGSERYPSFQFRDGRPLDAVRDILTALPDRMSPWEIAFWFVSANPWLDGAPPMDSLAPGGREDEAIEAARNDSERVIG